MTNKKLLKYSKEIEQARVEYRELVEHYKGKTYLEALRNPISDIFNDGSDLFDGDYKSMVYTVYNEKDMAVLSEHIDIYDNDGIAIFECFKVV